MFLLWRFKRFCFPLFFLLCLAHSPIVHAEGKELIFFDFDSSLSKLLPPSFPQELSEQLKRPLLDIGYRLSELHCALSPEDENRSHLILIFSLKPQTTDTDTQYTIQTDLVRINFSEGKQRSQSSPFISLSFSSSELSTVKTVLSRKIIENLRTHYICHLRVHSSPQGVRIRSGSGLEGVTPLEWIVPVGILTIEGKLKGYEPINHTVEISEPGVHTCYLQLRKRPFYQSRMMIPGAALLLTSAVCFFSERYYFNNYHDLQKNEPEKNSPLLEESYRRAKNFGYMGIASLVLSAVSFSLSFKF